MSVIVGIDLGTTNSCIAVLDGGESLVIHNQEGGRTTPSMVSWSESGDIIVGVASKRQMVTNPTRTIYGIKRLIGQKFDSATVKDISQNLPYKVVAAPNDDAWVEINGEALSPQEVSAHILGKMRDIAKDYLGKDIDEAIVTVPAYFDDVQRQATKDAGEIAGLSVRAILNEPTAAALAYGVHKNKDQRLAVFDLGGGTFDISILSIESGVFEVLSTHGDTHLGGDDFDDALINLLKKDFQDKHQIDLSEDVTARQRLKEAAERAKIELSSAMSTTVNLPFITVAEGAPIHLEKEITRAEFEGAVGELLNNLSAPCERALKDASCTPDEIDQVLLVGGMSRMPAVQSKVVDIFGKEPSKGVNPDEIVAMGAATQSGIMGGELQEVVLLDVTPHDLGIRVASGNMAVIVPAQSTIPARQSKTFATTKDGQTFVELEVYQGSDQAAKNNRHLGNFKLGDLPAETKGTVKVTVDFTIDADGLLEVTATESTSGKAATVSIEAHGGLSGDDIASIRNKAGF